MGILKFVMTGLCVKPSPLYQVRQFVLLPSFVAVKILSKVRGFPVKHPWHKQMPDFDTWVDHATPLLWLMSLNLTVSFLALLVASYPLFIRG